MKVLRRGGAGVASSNQGSIGSEVDAHPSIKGIKRSFPEALITVLLAIANNSTFDLINLIKPSLVHDGREHLTTNSSSAVGDNRLGL